MHGNQVQEDMKLCTVMSVHDTHVDFTVVLQITGILYIFCLGSYAHTNTVYQPLPRFMFLAQDSPNP